MKSKQQPVFAQVKLISGTNRVMCIGAWDLEGLPRLLNSIKKISWPSKKELIFDGSAISHMDTGGAWELCKLEKYLEEKGYKITLEDFRPEHEELYSLACTALTKKLKPPPFHCRENWVAQFGRRSIHQTGQVLKFLSFWGEMSIVFIRNFFNPKALPWRTLFSTLETAGYQALPIIALLSFLVGVTLSYQIALQLRNYGANLYIVDLLGGSILREFGILLAAIMVAGRTGAAFTAQLGTMQLNEEIDALSTMGIIPTEFLVVPRMIAMVIVLPLLTVWADFFGVFGGMLMAKYLLHINFFDFLNRFQHNISLGSFLMGIVKAPVFALVIASIGCFQGMQVRGGADSVGRNTTRSVVQSIFMIIVADAAFSIIFSKVGI